MALIVFGLLMGVVSIALAMSHRRERKRLEQMRPCPYCLTVIPAAALVCRQCLRDLPPAPPLEEREGFFQRLFAGWPEDG